MVLLVEEEHLLRWTIAQHLARSGIRVREGDPGQPLNSSLDGVKLVLLDLAREDLAEMGPLEAIKGCRPGVKVLLMSAALSEEERIRAFAKGASGMLLKPFDVAEACRVVEEMLEAV